MDYPGFIPVVLNNVAYIFRDGYVYNVDNTELRLKTGDWVTGIFDEDNNRCSKIEKTAGPLKTILSDEAFYFLGGYYIGREYVSPFGKVDISKVPAGYKPGEVVTAMFKLVMQHSCTVTVEEILFSHSNGTFHPSSAIPVDALRENNQTAETDQEDTNQHQQNANSKDPFYSLSDPKFLAGDDDSDDEIPIDFDPVARFRRPKILPILGPEVKAEEEIPPVPLPKDYPSASNTSNGPDLPFYYGKNATDPSIIKLQVAPVRKDVSFTPSPTSTSPFSPVNPNHETAKTENLNKNVFLMQKQHYIPHSEGSSPGLSTDSDGFNGRNGYPRPFSPRYSDVEDEFSVDEDAEYDLNPDEDDEIPFLADAYDPNSNDNCHDQYDIDSHVYDTDISDKSYPSLNNSSDVQIHTFDGPAEHIPNKIEYPLDDAAYSISAEVSSESLPFNSSDESLHFDGRGPKEYMNDPQAWSHAYKGEKFYQFKEFINRHLLFAKFENFAVLYDSDAERDNFGVIFRDETNLNYYDSLVVGGVYKGTRGELFDCHSAHGMPSLYYYLIRPEKIRQCEVHNSIIYVDNLKKRRAIKRSWTWHDFSILEVENFGTIAFPRKYVHLLRSGVLIKGTARFYVHPKIAYFWGFVGEFTFFKDERGQTIHIDETESFHQYIKTKYADYLKFAGPEFYNPLANDSGANSEKANQKRKDPNTPFTRRELESIMPTYEYLHLPPHMPHFAKWKDSFEFV